MPTTPPTDILAAYRDLTPSELAALIERDPTSAESLTRYQQMDAQLSALPRVQPDARLRQHFQVLVGKKRERGTGISAVGKPLTAGALLLLLIGFSWMLIRQQSVPTVVGDGCPISPPQTVWEGTGPMAGDHPIWMTTHGQQTVTRIDDASGTPRQVSEGVWSRALLLVDEQAAGNLVVTGRQLDGAGEVYFLHRLSQDEVEWLPQAVIMNAHESDIIGKPDGRVQHFIAWATTGTGCYELLFSLAGYEVPIVVEVIEE